jgi:hypothetical protein
MTRRLAWVLLAGAAVLGLLAIAVASRRDRPAADRGGEVASGEAADDDAEPVRVELYFPGENGRLVGEPREVAYSADRSTFAARIVESLLAGPGSEPPYRPFPPDVTVGEVHVDADGVAWVDLRSETHPTPPVVGSTAEMLTLYSLVNSVVGNVEGARSLVLLWNGRQPRTFGGHIDTSHPLVPARFAGS